MVGGTGGKNCENRMQIAAKVSHPFPTLLPFMLRDWWDTNRIVNPCISCHSKKVIKCKGLQRRERAFLLKSSRKSPEDVAFLLGLEDREDLDK